METHRTVQASRPDDWADFERDRMLARADLERTFRRPPRWAERKRQIVGDIVAGVALMVFLIAVIWIVAGLGAF